jgi:hypothetical protein
MTKTDDVERVLWVAVVAVVGLLVYRCSGFSFSPTLFPFVRVAMLAVVALVGVIAFSAYTETKVAADFAVWATPFLFGVAALALLIGTLFVKVNEAVANLPTLLQ